MKLFRKISIFLVLALVLCSIFSLSAFATEEAPPASEQTTEQVINSSSKLDMNMGGADMSIGERASYALQGTVTGMLMVFAVLALLAAIVSLSKVIFYDIPNKKAEKEKAAKLAAQQANVQEAQNIAKEEPTVQPVAEATSDSELAAVITAAIASMLDTEEYANEFKSGFRVVSFKKANTNNAWNKN